jgi:hypothetical protein
MTKEEVKAFVTAMTEAGSNIQAIERVGYVLAEPVDPTDREAYRRIQLVSSASASETISRRTSSVTSTISAVW